MPHEEGHAPEQSGEEFLRQLESLFSQGSAGGELPASEQPIGGAFAGPAGPISPQQGFVGPLKQQHPNAIATSYNQGDDVNVLMEMNTEQLARFQDTLVANGIVREVIPGRIDENTRKGMQTLMTLGNRQSTRWQAVLDGVVEAGGLAGGQRQADEFDPQPYLAPDTASIAQEVKGMVRERLGRDPDEYEMAELSAELTGYDRLRHQREQELAEMQHEQQTTPGVQEGGEVRAVDPAARFREFFEQKYANELDFIEERETTGQISEAVGNTFAVGSQMSRGGR